MTENTKQHELVPPATAGPQPADAPATEPSTLEQELAEAKARADENWDKFLRAAADLENYRKRVAREREDIVRATSERVVAALLPVLDNLERALVAAEKHETDNDSLLEGLHQIQTQFRRTLEDFGLKEVAAHEGHPFDPHIHEAIGHVESEEHPEGTVTNQLQRGYKLADRLLRPARVVVSKGAPAKADAKKPNSK